MKKIVLTLFAFSVAVAGFAQSHSAQLNTRNHFTPNNATLMPYSTASKTGDTFARYNFPAIYAVDSSLAYYEDYAYPLDSGFVSGMTPLGYKAFAERFDYAGADSSVTVIGAYAMFIGNYNSSSTKTIKMKVWQQGAKTQLATHVAMNGLPATAIDSTSFSIKNLGINRTNFGYDTLKRFNFTTATPYLADSFFVGFEFSYIPTSMGGDTIALRTTPDGIRSAPFWFINGADTLVNVKNATQVANGTWYENFFFGEGFFNDYVIAPIFIVKVTTGILDHGISKNNLTFFGSYPNPATNQTNVKIGLKNTTNVTISIMDISGRTVATIAENKLSAGEHEIPVNISSLAAGVYTYLVRTQEGDGMASQFTIVK